MVTVGPSSLLLKGHSLVGSASELEIMHLAAVLLFLLLPAASSGGAGTPLRSTAFAPPALGTLRLTRARLPGRATSPAVPLFGVRTEKWNGLRMALAMQPGWGGYVDRSNQV